MDYIRVTKDNLESEHICCAISNNKDVQVASKKAWLAERLDEGLVFLKSVERGKCFIEYLPAEMAWNPIEAEGWLYIDCLWVSGSFKGHGYSNDLLAACIADGKAQGKKGLCILAAAKKKPFLADPPGTPKSTRRVMCSTTPASAPSTPSMSPSWSRRQRNTAFPSGRSIWRAGRRRKTPRRRSRPTRCFITGNISPTSR